jgi:hypothetical protein
VTLYEIFTNAQLPYGKVSSPWQGATQSHAALFLYFLAFQPLTCPLLPVAPLRGGATLMLWLKSSAATVCRRPQVARVQFTRS